MLHLIPRPLHRVALRGADIFRSRYRRMFKPALAGVSVIAVDARGHILLVRHTYGSRRWALPGGGLNRGETAEACARREMAEELGCAVTDVAVMNRIEEVISGAPHISWLVRVRLVGTPQVDRREIERAEWFAPHALPDEVSEMTRRRIALVMGAP